MATNTSRPLVDSDGENRALRTFLNHVETRSFENLRIGLTESGWEGCVPDWASNAKGYVTAAQMQTWIRFILAQEQVVEAPAATVPVKNQLFFVRSDSANGENLDLLVIAKDKAQAELFWREHYDFQEEAPPIEWIGAVPGVVPTEEADAIDWEAVKMD